MQQSLDISWSAIVLFSSLLLIPMGISRKYHLGLTKETVLSVGRMAAQLALVGVYLQYLFALDSAVVNLVWLLVMIAIGASAIANKAQLKRRQVMPGIGLGMTVALFPMLVVMTVLLVKPTPLYSAQYLIPLGGMLLGNSMGAIIIALNSLSQAFTQRQLEYQGAIALGVTPRYACRQFVSEALSRAMAPTLATMSTTGLVTLPGMMTGQILGGVSPMVAIKYQLVIMIAIFVVMNIATVVTIEWVLQRQLLANGRVLLTRKDNP